jgi:hypothetical protein
MTSDNVFSDWLKRSLIKRYIHLTRQCAVNITFQRLAPYETKENDVMKAYFKGKINI